MYKVMIHCVRGWGFTCTRSWCMVRGWYVQGHDSLCMVMSLYVQGHRHIVCGQGFVCPRSWVHYARSIHTVVAFTEILIMDISEKRLVLCTVLVGLKMLIMGNAGRRSFYVQCQYFSNC